VTTPVAFHAGLADKLGYACRLLRKAYRQGATVVVCGAADDLDRLDALIWTFDPTEFIPHRRLRSGPPSAPRYARTPIWLADVGAVPPPAEVLVNLSSGIAPGIERYQRVIELVSTDPDDRAAGRRRWQTYKAGGSEPTLHSKEPPA
jgi:DNA polymerase-3 subunit chi